MNLAHYLDFFFFFPLAKLVTMYCGIVLSKEDTFDAVLEFGQNAVSKRAA